MTNIRIKRGSTHSHSSALHEMLNDRNAKKITLFATNCNSDDNNSPLLNALIEYEIPNTVDLNIVCDGTFLTVARYPRYCEVRDFFDMAEQSDKVFFSNVPLPNTEVTSVDEMAANMKAHTNLEQFTKESRKELFKLLSNLTEEQYRKLYP